MMSLNPKRKLLICAAALSLVASLGCTVGTTAEDLKPMFEDLAYQPLVMNPVTGTEVGYHVHTGDGGEVKLDEELGDYSSAGIQARVAFYSGIQSRMQDPEQAPERERLNGEPWIDYGVLEGRVARGLFEWQTRKRYATDPNFYMEILGRAIFVPVVDDYASESARAGHILARLQKVPEFLSQAQGNLTSSSALQIEAAKSQIDGLVQIIRTDIPAQMPSASGGEYSAAADGAVSALNDFSSFLDGLATTGDWRMGADLFQQKLRVDSGQPDLTLNAVLDQLQKDYDEVYQQLIETARPIHRSIYGNQRPPTEFAMMRDILDIVSDDNRLREESGMVAQVREDIDTARSFMTEEQVMAFPQGGDLSVSETPAFLRGRFPVSAFEGAPVLEPRLGAHLWLTPLPASASRGVVLAKLREYNNFKLQIVAIDALARYAQSATAALGDSEMSETTRLLRVVDGNRAYTAGWNTYAVGQVMDFGYNSNNANFQLNWLKYKLEFLANAMIDIKLHTQNMTEQEAETMLRQQVFMESGAVSSAVHSIQVNPTDSAIAYVGAYIWDRVRQRYQELTTDFSLSSFHSKALAPGPLPPDELIYLTTTTGMTGSHFEEHPFTE